MSTRSGTEERKKSASEKKGNSLIYILYAALILCIIGYILTGLIVIGAIAFILILVVIAMEFRSSLRSEGAMKTLVDVIVAVVAAVIIFWLIPAAALSTSSPINVVASCSMLPVLHRGDLVFLHGIANMSAFLSRNHIPVVNVSQAEFNGMTNNMQSEFIEPFAYFNGDRSQISSIITNNRTFGVGFYSLECIASQSQASQYGRCYVPTQQGNLIRYNYSTTRLVTPQGNESIVYVPSITIGNTTVVENYSNPIIVYKTTKQDYFTGDIIHRLFAAMRVGNSYYLLTKGDNNPVLDIESLNYPANSSDVLGYVVFGVPYLGYPSLIIKGQIGNVPGCNQTIMRS